jgi:hypothetical protein
MKRLEMRLMERKASTISLPEEGVSLTAFGEMLLCHPSDAAAIVRTLHRKKLIWMSERRGHVRVFPIGKHQGRGRPKAEAVVEPDGARPGLPALVADLAPLMLRILHLRRSRPDEHWMVPGVGEAIAEIDSAVAIEAGNVTARCRKATDGPPSVPLADIREALWLLYPSAMPLIVKSQPWLAIDGAALPVIEAPAKRMANNLGTNERVWLYIQAAGHDGIGAYEIRSRFAGKITREELGEITDTLESIGMIHVRECRRSGKGPMGTRFFDASLGEPNITPSGRLIHVAEPLKLPPSAISFPN